MERNIFVIGDLHGDYDLIDAKFGDIKDSSKEKYDVLFVAGDAGFVNSYETIESKNKRIKHLNSLPYIIIVVLGNHENYDVIEKFNETSIFGGKCYKEDGVDVKFIVGEGMFHIYPLFPSPEARAAFKIVKEEFED
jgi:predicted phosphodiesterase